MPLVHL